MADEQDAKAPAGWYEQDDQMRYWDGKGWGPIAPPPSVYDSGVIVWALALAFGVAGVLGWSAPVIAFYWPMGLGGAGIALAFAARLTSGETPWWAIIAVIASIVALLIGIEGMSQINDAREGLDELSY